jgi:hypothetical protein
VIALPLTCPSCKAILIDRPDEQGAEKELKGRVCDVCGDLLNEAELQRQADALAAALFEELDE